MIEPLTIDAEEKAKLRRSFEFGAYVAITQYLARTYGLSELQKFAEFWAGLAADQRKHLMSKSHREFIEAEAKVEKVWVDREAKRMDDKGYVGVVDACPLRRATNTNRGDLPLDYFCDSICAVIYPEGYKALGLKSAITKFEKGCKVEIDLEQPSPADG
jgi:hypothetical protein